MAVYVDPLFIAVAQNPASFRIGERTGHRWSRMWADSEEELHAFAREIGISGFHFQKQPLVSYYDLTPSLRVKAVVAGAVETGVQGYAGAVKQREEDDRIARWLRGETI